MALDPQRELEAAERSKQVQAEVGHPVLRWETLKARVQNEAIRKFGDVGEEFLELMWCLDAYRQAQAPPEGMGKPAASWSQRLEGAYRGKGNWFATLLALLLDNRTGATIRSRGNIEGFSQTHQIDLAWPDRKLAPIVCVESKVTGAPSFGDTRARGALHDWTNRRKELKFAATDLKLARREQTESIGHWDVWRKNALPKCFMVWAARLSPDDKLAKMMLEATALVQTYLDGAGIAAWQAKQSGRGYRFVPLPKSQPGLQVVELDNALWQIESEIAAARAKGLDKLPIQPAAPIDPTQLALEDE